MLPGKVNHYNGVEKLLLYASEYIIIYYNIEDIIVIETI